MINDRKKRMLTCQVWLTTVLVTPTVFRKKECRQHLWDSLHSVYLKNPSTWRQQEVEVDKILRVTGSRGHEIFNIIQTSGSKWKTKEVRAKRMHPYLKNQEVLTGRGKVPNAESTKYRNLDSQPQAIEKPAYGAVTTDVRYWVPRFILSPHLPLASPLQQFCAEPPHCKHLLLLYSYSLCPLLLVRSKMELARECPGTKQQEQKKGGTHF